MKNFVSLSLLASALVLSACGGGGDSTPTPTPTPTPTSTPTPTPSDVTALPTASPTPTASTPTPTPTPTVVDPADKYVGIWLSKCHSYVAASGNTWFRQTTRILTKVSAIELNTTHVQKNTYSDTTCTSLHNTDTYTYSSGKYNIGNSVTFLGTASDEIVYTDFASNAASIGFMAVSGGQWFIRTYLAADGLPNSWSSTSPYAKQ